MIIYPDILNKTTLSNMTVKSKSFTRATGMCLICNMLIHIFGGTINTQHTQPALTYSKLTIETLGHGH